MSHLVLISHGTFCEHLKQSTEMIMGPQETIHAVALLPEEGPEEFQTKLQAVLDGLEEYVILCDLAGGTPSNVAAKMLMSGASFELYSGMNMPMVISFINGEMIGAKANLVADAREGIAFINDLLTADDDDEDE